MFTEIKIAFNHIKVGNTKLHRHRLLFDTRKLVQIQKNHLQINFTPCSMDRCHRYQFITPFRDRVKFIIFIAVGATLTLRCLWASTCVEGWGFPCCCRTSWLRCVEAWSVLVWPRWNLWKPNSAKKRKTKYKSYNKTHCKPKC